VNTKAVLRDLVRRDPRRGEAERLLGNTLRESDQSTSSQARNRASP
jgi:hypothetical protein